MGLLLLLWEGLHVLVGLDDGGSYILGVGVDLLDVSYASPQLLTLRGGERAYRAMSRDVDIG